MRKITKLSVLLLILLVTACLTQQAYARLTVGPFFYDTTGTCGKSLLFTVKDGVMRIQGTSVTDSGILTGTTDTTLSPQDPTSVQEAIVLVLRLYRHISG